MTSGAGAAAISIVKLLLSAGFQNVTMCDRKGAIYKGRDGLNWIKEEMAEVTNLDHKSGSLADMLVGADVHRRFRARNGDDRDGPDDEPRRDHLRLRESDAGNFPGGRESRRCGGYLDRPERFPEPDQQRSRVPGIFRGAFDVRASDINEEMKMAAAKALADLISEDELSAEYIIPKAFDKRVGPAVAKAVAEAARKSGVARM